jgi:hypothetical protein
MIVPEFRHSAALSAYLQLHPTFLDGPTTFSSADGSPDRALTTTKVGTILDRQRILEAGEIVPSFFL